MGEASGIAACLVLWADFILLFMMEQTAGAANRVQCLNNYGFQGRRVDCQWYHNQALGEISLYLNFSDSLRLYSDLICPLSASASTLDHFSCSAYSNEGEFTENDEYDVILHTISFGEYRTYLIFAKYKPRLHIECDPPFDLQSQCSANKCQIQWKTPKAYEEILEDWQWELAFKATQEPWEQAQRRILVIKETRVDIEGTEFKSGRDYVARIRCKTPDTDQQYRSQWSPWSSPTAWMAPQGDWQQFDSHLPWTALIYFVVCLGALLLLLALALKVLKRYTLFCFAGGISSISYTVFSLASFSRVLHPADLALLSPRLSTTSSRSTQLLFYATRLEKNSGENTAYILFYAMARRNCRGTSIPTPAAFFQPLYLTHHGNFKGWIGLPERRAWLSSSGEGEAVPPVPVSQLSWSLRESLQPKMPAPSSGSSEWREGPKRPPCANGGDYCTLGGGGEGEPGRVPLELLLGSSAERPPSTIEKGRPSAERGE